MQAQPVVMSVFAIKGNVINYVITIVSMSQDMILITYNCNHRNNIHSTSTPLHSSRTSLYSYSYCLSRWVYPFTSYIARLDYTGLSDFHSLGKFLCLFLKRSLAVHSYVFKINKSQLATIWMGGCNNDNSCVASCLLQCCQHCMYI